MRELYNKYRPLFFIGVVIVIIGLWWAFRPELLFTKHPVDEPLPGSSSYIQVHHTVALTSLIPLA